MGDSISSSSPVAPVMSGGRRATDHVSATEQFALLIELRTNMAHVLEELRRMPSEISTLRKEQGETCAALAARVGALEEARQRAEGAFTASRLILTAQAGAVGAVVGAAVAYLVKQA